MNQTKSGFPIWNDDFDQEHFTPDEIAETDLRVAIITALVQARQEPQIARMERGDANPQLSTILKVLAPLGMTLAVVPIK